MSGRFVIDTNCLLQSISRRSRYYPIWRGFIDGVYTLCVTTEILEEYEEILGRYLSPTVARLVVAAFMPRFRRSRKDRRRVVFVCGGVRTRRPTISKVNKKPHNGKRP